MPKRKRTTTTRRRLTKRRRVAHPRRNPGNTLGFPASKIVKMRYSDTMRLDASAGLTAAHLYRANSIQDPDYTTGGHQPYTHDTWQTIYNHYEVIKSSIRVTFCPNGSSSSGNVVCGIAIRDDTTVEGDFDTVRESGKATYKVCSGNTNKVSCSKGYNKRIMFPQTQTQTGASFGSNPAEVGYFHVFATSLNDAIDPDSVDCLVTVNYTVKLWELKDLGQS